MRRTLYRMCWYKLYQSTSLCQELCLVLWVATNEDPSVCVIYMLSHIVFTVELLRHIDNGSRDML